MSSEKEEPPMVPLSDFDACVLDARIAALNQVDMTSVSLAYLQASATTPSPCKEVFRFLSEIAGIYLNPAERGRIWGPGGSSGNQRSMIPSDIRGEQSDVLEAVLPRVEHPALRARIADIVWTNDMRKGGVAKTAIHAYCDFVEGLMDGSLKAAYPVDGRDLIDAQTPAHRALQIASAITKHGAPLPDRVIAVLTTLYGEALKVRQPVIFSRIAQLCVEARPCASPRRCARSVVGRAMLFARRHLRLLASVSCLLSVLGEKMGRMGATWRGDRGARPLTLQARYRAHA